MRLALAILTFLPVLAAAEILSPTIYSTTIVDIAKKDCRSNKTSTMNFVDGSQLVLCKNEYRNCLADGGCLIRTPEKKIGVNFVKYDEDKELSFFSALDMNRCPYGEGFTTRKLRLQFKQICLDPFYSVAADLDQHPMGEVLFVEDLKGLELPNGEIHDGFVIVRDSGGYLKDAGAGILSFFTGTFRPSDARNPFTSKQFNNQDLKKQFRRATSQEADAVRKARNFPGLKTSVIQEAGAL